jgi:hypothetical protein
MLLMIWEGEAGAVGTTDDDTMVYYFVKWTSKPYALQEETEGVSGVIAAGAMVVKAVYFNMVECAPYWYTQSELMTVAEVRHVLWSGLQLEEISATNKLPLTCNRFEAMQKKAGRIATQEHDTVMEEAGRHDTLDFDKDEISNDIKESGSMVESDSNDSFN